MKKHIAFLIGTGFICIGYFFWHNTENESPRLAEPSGHPPTELPLPAEMPNRQKSTAIQVNQNKITYLPESISQEQGTIDKENLINTLDGKLKNNEQKHLTSHNKPTLEKLNKPSPRHDSNLAFNTPNTVVYTQSRKPEVEKAEMPPPPTTHQPLSRGKIQ